MRTFFFAFKTLLLLMLTQNSLGAISNNVLSAIEADAWRARMGFHLLSVRGNNPDDQAGLRAVLASNAERIAAMEDKITGEERRREASALARSWRDLSDRASNNPLATQGYADYSAMSEMNRLTMEVCGAAAALRADTPARYGDILSFSVKLLRLASEYVAVSAFPSAGLPTGTGMEPLDFPATAQSLDEELGALQTKYRNDTKAGPVVEFVGQRWAFIRTAIPRMDNAGAQRIPYLFYRYSSQAADRIATLIE